MNPTDLLAVLHTAERLKDPPLLYQPGPPRERSGA